MIQRLASLMPSRSSHVVHHSFLLTFSFSFLRHSAFRGFRGRDRRRGGTLIRRSLWVRYQPCASVERYKVSTYPHRTKESGPLEKKSQQSLDPKKKDPSYPDRNPTPFFGFLPPLFAHLVTPPLKNRVPVRHKLACPWNPRVY